MPSYTRRAPTALALLGFSLALPAVGGAQTSYTLDFSGLGLSNNTTIPSSYGDDAGMLDVSFRSRSGWGNVTPLVSTSAHYYGPNYNDLDDVGYVTLSAKVGEIMLDNLAAGHSITFEGADVGSWSNATTTVALRVYDFNWNLLYSGTGGTISDHTHASFVPGSAVTGTSGLYVQWARLDNAGAPSQAYDTGIDNVRFTIAPTVSAVPEPATVALLATGLAVVGVAARRRRATA